MLEQAGINLKGLNIDKLKAEYQDLTTQKNNLTATYKNCEKEIKSLSRKLKNLNEYLGRETLQKTHRSSQRKATNLPCNTINEM